MLEAVAEIIGESFRHLFNFIGATVRWAFGNLKKSNGKSLTYQEYLHGPDNNQEGIDEDEVSNMVIGGILFFAILIPILAYIVIR